LQVFPYKNYAYVEVIFNGPNAPPTETDQWAWWDGYYNIDKWYAQRITNTYQILSHAIMKQFAPDPWTDYQSRLYSLSPPDDTGYYQNIDFYFDWL